MIWWDLRRTLRDIECAADRWRLVEAWWDAHVAFGLANPARYALMYGDPRPGALPTAVAAALGLLEGLVRRA